MSVIKEIREFWDDFMEWIETIGKDTISFMKPLAKEIANSGGEVLFHAAINAVRKAEATNGSGSEKFQAAKDEIIMVLRANSLPIVMNAVHGAIEAAVAKMKQ